MDRFQQDSDKIYQKLDTLNSIKRQLHGKSKEKMIELLDEEMDILRAEQKSLVLKFKMSLSVLDNQEELSDE